MKQQRATCSKPLLESKPVARKVKSVSYSGGGTYWISVYDSNWPEDANRHVQVNYMANTWSYNMGGVLGTWSGNVYSYTLGAIPISIYAQQPQCPWCGVASSVSRAPKAASFQQVWLTGQSHLLLTDSEGRRIGYVGDQFVNEIPGAFRSVPVGGLGVSQEPIYSLPLTTTYAILLSGQTLTQTQTVGVAQFGPGYAISADDVTLNPSTNDTLTFAPDGTQMTYRPGNSKSITMTLALDGSSESNQFKIKGADISSGKVTTVTVTTGNVARLVFSNRQVGNGNFLVFNNKETNGGAYDLEMSRVGTAGERKFAHFGIVVSATDTHYVDYGTWDGTGPVTLYIDRGSKGTIDETRPLSNQANQLFLPFIIR
jgi:hypothetical protein